MHLRNCITKSYEFSIICEVGKIFFLNTVPHKLSGLARTNYIWKKQDLYLYPHNECDLSFCSFLCFLSSRAFVISVLSLFLCLLSIYIPQVNKLSFILTEYFKKCFSPLSTVVNTDLLFLILLPSQASVLPSLRLCNREKKGDI